MIKGKLDFKLINIALFAVISYFIYESLDLWLNILGKLIKIILPFFLGFAVSYSLYPILICLNKKVPKFIGIFIILFVILLIFIFTFILLIPVSGQIINFLQYVIIFVQNINIDSNILNIINNYITEIGTYLSNGLFKTINLSINVITNIILIISSSIYFLIDMDKIRIYFKSYLKNKSIKLFNYFKMIDLEMKKYIQGFIKIIFISFFEYIAMYYLLDHPYFLLLGILSCLSNFIPYFGGMIVQVLAVITGLVVSPQLGIKVAIFTLILGLFDSYIINPLVYGKSNQLHPIITIISVFAGGILFGFIGVLISVPISIIIINSIKFKNN